MLTSIPLIWYRFRYSIYYVIIGIISLFVELVLFNFLQSYGIGFYFASIISLILGILTSYWLNTRYNFKISKPKRRKSLIYFVLISTISYAIQVTFISKVEAFVSYELARILVSGSIFWIAYLLHRKYSFKDFKKVGIAIYSNGLEKIDVIYNNIGDFADFIHVDIVDDSILEGAPEVKSYKAEVIRAYWQKKFIEVHIMSLYPAKWIEQVIDHVDRIYVHNFVKEDLGSLLSSIKSRNKQAGIVIQTLEDFEFIQPYLKLIDSLLILAIKQPGYSGQSFNYDVLQLIKVVNQSPHRDKFQLNVDGGVNGETIKLIDSENVVSGSFVLKAEQPKRNIIILQTSSQYESV